VSDKKLKRGEPVTWQSSGGTISGTVVRELTSPNEIKGYHVAASPANPEYLVKSDQTGAEAAHKPAALNRAKRA
jgi:hypothetical protein